MVRGVKKKKKKKDARLDPPTRTDPMVLVLVLVLTFGPRWKEMPADWGRGDPSLHLGAAEKAVARNGEDSDKKVAKIFKVKPDNQFDPNQTSGS